MSNVIASRSGCKVGWRYYATEADALAARPAVIETARRREMQGYDFGFCAPGSIRQMDSDCRDKELAGLWELCTS